MATCLIVDDSGFMRNIIKDILKKGEYEVVGEATSGEEAVLKYEQLKPDVVTMDINMAGMDGLDAVKKIIQKYPDAKIIMCSALMGHEWVIMDAIQAGASDYITKPFQENTVIDSVARVLAK